MKNVLITTIIIIIIIGAEFYSLKGINLVLEDDQIIELIRILIDDDATDALSFLKAHFKGKARELLEGG